MSLELNVDNLLESNPPDKEQVKLIAKAYSTALAISMINGEDRPFARVSENVEVDHGECRRQLMIDWHLPTLTQALPRNDLMSNAKFIDAFNEMNPVLVVPIFIVRKGRLMNNFCVEDPSGGKLYLCGTDEWQERSRLMLRFFWGLVDLVPVEKGSYTEGRLAELKRRYLELPTMDTDAATARVEEVFGELGTIGVPFYPGVLGRLRYVGNYVAKRHLIWLHLTSRPGQAARLSVSYRTRFSADYLPKPRNGHRQPRSFYRRADEWVRRAVGQEPYEFRIPLAMHSVCTSYHFTQTAPPGTFFLEQRFAHERTLTMPKDQQIDTFDAAIRKLDNVHVQGKNEAGGPVAHLYVRNLPSTVGDQIYAYTLLRERPPGTTALVMWLTLFASIFFWFYWLIWDRLVIDDTKGIDVAALFVALPGLASIWFSRAFKDDIRPRIPLVSRIGLLAVGMSAFYSLLGVVVQRGVCNPAAAPCSPILTSIFSHQVLLVIAGLLTALTVWLIGRRFRFQKSYRVLQKNIIERYSR
ncbi:hypothetical protein DMA12_13670 [Amycolatopsis balhimycina DSM 5908]|uniref:Uncharacterized protein n=1 Tax=Amycolatopsis balhimycina DSM 5908 TaxID=1081091 RepID=A0A428WQZ3_AMYBA|nr:hypothetical protein [Amycolatopsis balhimycina]RSM45506.1 hypothetical protein DMA12_13670 [Amycolatopsis balhimycina DSM 5908]